MTERMWRVVTVFRVITLAYAVVLITTSDHRYTRPALGMALLAVMVTWTVITGLAYARPGGRGRWLITADVAVAAA